MIARKCAPASTVAMVRGGAAAATAAASSSGPKLPVAVSASTRRASASAARRSRGRHPAHFVMTTRSSMAASGPSTSTVMGASVAQAGDLRDRDNRYVVAPRRRHRLDLIETDRHDQVRLEQERRLDDTTREQTGELGVALGHDTDGLIGRQHRTTESFDRPSTGCVGPIAPRDRRSPPVSTRPGCRSAARIITSSLDVRRMASGDGAIISLPVGS